MKHRILAGLAGASALALMSATPAHAILQFSARSAVTRRLRR